MAISVTTRQKDLGAYYTDAATVAFLVSWAMRGKPSRVMDPSCGDGRFLVAAARQGAPTVVGYDLDEAAVAKARAALAGSAGNACLIQADFFAVEPSATPLVDAVVGNPPFIRYQRFTGRSRAQALLSARLMGASLTALSSSWAPFVLHAARFLRPAGRLAMVVPAEIANTQYGRVTLRALCAHFGRVRLLLFDQNLFEEAQTETFLLLASSFGGRCDSVEVLPLRGVDDLIGLSALGGEPGYREYDVLAADSAPLAEVLLDDNERAAWRAVLAPSAVLPLRSLGTVTNGFVSGDNAFFLRGRAAMLAAGYPAHWLVPSARNSRSLAGLRFTEGDIVSGEQRGAGHHLVVPDGELWTDDAALRRWVAEGEAAGVPERYKCRARHPWWLVPGLQQADVLFSYMAAKEPRAASNRAGALYTNTLHGLRLAEPELADTVAATFYNSLTLLSLELTGRSYGGGVLKVEPRELADVLLPMPHAARAAIRGEFDAIDRLLRAGRYADAVLMVDRVVLVDGLGLDARTVDLLRSARRRLMDRRMGRARRRDCGTA